MLRWDGGGGGRGVRIIMHGRSRMTMNPHIPIYNAGRSTSGIHRPDRHCSYRTRSAVRCSASRLVARRVSCILLRTACAADLHMDDSFNETSTPSLGRTERSPIHPFVSCRSVRMFFVYRKAPPCRGLGHRAFCCKVPGRSIFLF